MCCDSAGGGELPAVVKPLPDVRTSNVALRIR